MKPHILIYTDDPGTGGLEPYDHAIACRLVHLGYRVTHAHHKISSLTRREETLGIKQVRLEFNAGTDRWRCFKDLMLPQKILSATQPDLIFFSDGWPFSNFAAKQVAIEQGLPYLIALGFVEPSCVKFSLNDGVPYLDLASSHYARARSVIAVSYDNLNLLQEILNLPKKKGQVIYYGRPSEYFTEPKPSVRQRLREELSIPLNAVVCLTPARLASVKGHAYQLEAIAHLKHTSVWPQLYFLWAGTGAGLKYDNLEPKLKETVKNLGVTERVKFLGHREDIPDLLDASDMLVLPSKAEGMPLAVMEAMAKGVPVIASAVSGIPEELGDTGKLLPNPNIDEEGTVRELISTIQAWATNTQLRQKIGQAEKQRAEKLFVEERMLQETIAVIEGCLAFNPLTSERSPHLHTSVPIQELDRRIYYSSLVWQAWSHYQKGDIPKMLDCLEASLNSTPFLPTETLLNWIESFTKFSEERGRSLNTHRLSNLPEWQELMAIVMTRPSKLT